MSASIEPRQALWAYLHVDTGVMDAVGGRLYQRRVPLGATLPLLVIWPPISRVPVRDLAGVMYWRSRLQVTAIAGTQPQAEKAIGAVIGAVEGFKGAMSGLDVMEATVENDRASEQADADEVHHHVDLILLTT